MAGLDETKERVKRTIKRSRLGVIGGRIGAERIRDLRRVVGRKENPMGATHRGFSLKESLDYIDAVFADYALCGARGPGD